MKSEGLSTVDVQLKECNLVTRSVGRHKMVLDKTDKGISKVLIKKGFGDKWPREPEFMDIIKGEVSEGMKVFDLGANVGYVTLILADLVGEKGHVYAVEPSPINFALLNKNIKLNGYENRVSAYQIAISNVNGKSKFFISGASNLHGLNKSKHMEEIIEVQVQTADEFFKDKSLPNFMKMDIEGAEVEAIEGMMKTLENASSPIKILIETHPMYYNPDHAFEPGLRQLIAFGFNIKYVITTGLANPPYFSQRGYKPSKVYKSSTWDRSIFVDVSNEDAIEATCGQYRQIVKRSIRSCLARPWRIFNRNMVNERIVRGLLLEK